MTDNEHWIFLEQLRKTGVTNMYGATPYIEAEFGVNRDEAREILIGWMKNYNPNDYKQEV